MATLPPASRRPDPIRVRSRVTGVVQGVGFRPHVYRLATDLGLSGFVRNDADGVVIEVEGSSDAVRTFRHRLRTESPPLAEIEHVTSRELKPGHSRQFYIETSASGSPESARVTPDYATCEDCLRELFDPSNPRHRYPFINCTNCGPRFTISLGVPWDRARTTMAAFEMCEACRAEYEDPLDRRFHAQPNACPACGPSLRLEGHARAERPDTSPLEAAVAALRGGEIVAVKGLGGFHLACLANDAGAVARLRARKHREHKPFAVMAADLDAASDLVILTDVEAGLLESRERPIVLARRRHEAPVAPAAAPGHRDLGVFLPYTPLHHLLLRDVGHPLVMTSGNRSDEPIAYRDDDAVERLSGIADLLLLHDRPIAHRLDDSVVRAVRVSGPGAGGPPAETSNPESRPLLLRRARGYVPRPIPLSPPLERPVFAAGAQLKSTFALGHADRAWVSHHIGDLDDLAAWTSYREGVASFETLLGVDPVVVAHDLHPGYRATRYAEGRVARCGGPAAGGAIALEVQHHHAHLAAVLAEHGETGPALGVMLDGTGYGMDGTVWGGELLLGGPAGFQRVGHLRPVRMPGGEAAVRQPWRMACAWLCELEEHGEDDWPALPPWLEDRIEPARWRAVARLAGSGLGSPLTSSVGRLFDAVSALCGVRLRSTYEGQAAIELEMRAAHSESPPLCSYELSLAGEPLILDPRDLVRGIRDDLASGVAVETVARAFHQAIAEGLVRACLRLSRTHQLETVALSGGVFQNVLLLESVAARLLQNGLRPLVPRLLPPNDGGISYGQLAVAAARLEQR